ncbi:MAG: phosphotransferase [Pseudomonadota bacterium]
MELVYNKQNAVTADLSRCRWDGKPAIRKTLSGVNGKETRPEWRASEEPRHWNYWRREIEVYRSEFRELVADAQVRLPQLFHVEEGEQHITLILEDVGSRTGTGLSEIDYEVILRRWGQAQGLLAEQNFLRHTWTSEQFIRRYTTSKPVDWRVLGDSDAWQLPVIRKNWPGQLKEGLQFLYQHREALYGIVENAQQLPSHLDFWPNNVILDDQGWVVLIDLGFAGSGAWGEDLGNFIPDAVFDGFVLADSLHALESRLLHAYLEGLSSGGIEISEKDVRKSMYASAVKYVWLGPLLLTRALMGEYQRYGGGAPQDIDHQYAERGKTLMHLFGWAEKALGQL